MLQFISLSSGSSGNCYYFNYNGFGLLIDLGISMRALKQHFSNYGLALAQIQAALITHLSVRAFAFMPDAGRVAPIRGSVCW